MNEYRDWLRKNEYAPKCVENYSRGAVLFLGTGKPLTMESVSEWEKENEKLPPSYVLGALHYIQYKTTGVCRKHKSIDKSKRKSMPRKYSALDPFREWLKGGGYANHTVYDYVQGAYVYLEDGGTMDEESIDKYCKSIVGRKNYRNIRSGIRKYYQYVNGLDTSRRPHKRNVPRTCNEDCFNCIYEDCILD